MASQWVVLAKAPYLTVIAIALVTCCHNHHAGAPACTNGVKYRCGADHVDVEGLTRVQQAGPNNGLGGQGEDDLGLTFLGASEMSGVQ